MKAFTDKATRFKGRIKKKEQGYTLVEILVAVALFAFITVMVTSALVTSVDSAKKFGNVSVSQNDVSVAANKIQRDLSVAQYVDVAKPNIITVTGKKNNVDTKVTYFLYDPAVSSTLPDGVDTSALPDYPALMSVRYNIADESYGQEVVVKNVNLKGFKDVNKQQLFNYYSADNSLITNATTSDTLALISRIEFRISVDVEGRGTPIQIESSATPLKGLKVASVYDESIPLVPTCPASFTATNGTPTATTEAGLRINVAWSSVSGATSYRLNRVSVPAVTVSDETVTGLTYADSRNLKYGSTYTYKITVTSPTGVNTNCAPVSVTIQPGQPDFKNINSLASRTDLMASGATTSTVDTKTRAADGLLPAATVTTRGASILASAKYTVARNLVNQLVWAQVPGAIGYKLYDGTTLVKTVVGGGNTNTAVPTAFGDVKTYTVKAYNTAGDGLASSSVSLISPPEASTFTATALDTSTNSTTSANRLTVTTRAANTTGYRVFKSESLDSTVACTLSKLNANYMAGSTVTTTDSTPKWGSVNCYRMVPYNNAGNGELSSAVRAYQKPGKFTMSAVGQDNTEKSLLTDQSAASLATAKSDSLAVTYNSKTYYGAQCWSVKTGTYLGQDRKPCAGGTTPNPSNMYALGKVGDVDKQNTKIAVTWTKSMNAYGKYYTEKNRNVQSSTKPHVNGVRYNKLNCGTTDSCAAAYWTAYNTANTQGVEFRNEEAGSGYQFTTTARSAAGQTRDSNTVTYVSAPDVVRAVSTKFMTRSATANPYSYMRIRTIVSASSHVGNTTNTVIVSYPPASAGSTSLGTLQTNTLTGSGNNVIIDGPGYTYGRHYEGAYNSYTLNGVTKTSINLEGDGDTTIGCTFAGGCGTDWKAAPNQYPTYWAGTFYRSIGAYAPSTGAKGAVEQGTQSATPTPVYKDELVSSASVDCNILTEGTTAFTSSGCALGTGIPASPTGLTYTADAGDNKIKVSWNPTTSTANLKFYVVRVTSSNGTDQLFTPTATSQVITLPPGTASTITLAAQNNSSINSAAVSKSTAQLSPAKPLNVVKASGEAGSGQIKISWVKGQNSKGVMVYKGSTLLLADAQTGTSVTLTANITDDIRVRSRSTTNDVPVYSEYVTAIQ